MTKSQQDRPVQPTGVPSGSLPDDLRTTMLQCAERIRAGDYDEDEPSQLAELCQALDRWLLQGGRLPLAWASSGASAAAGLDDMVGPLLGAVRAIGATPGAQREQISKVLLMIIGALVTGDHEGIERLAALIDPDTLTR